MASNKKRWRSAISLAVSLIIFSFALSVFIITLNARSKNRPAEIFGYSFAVVVSNSMYPEIKIGDLIIVKSCEIEQMAVGQNAVFIGDVGNLHDQCIVHRVEEINPITDSAGNLCGVSLVTKGIANDLPDENQVYASNFIGREIFHSSALGSIFSFLKKPLNWLYILVILIAMAVIIGQIKRIVKIRRQQKTENKDSDTIKQLNDQD